MAIGLSVGFLSCGWVVYSLCHLPNGQKMKLDILVILPLLAWAFLTLGILVAANANVVESDSAPIPEPFQPYKMADWAICADGKQVYTLSAERPLDGPLAAPCAVHGGLRAYGPGASIKSK